MGALARGISAACAWLNQIVWGVPMLLLLVGTGIFLSVRTGFFPCRRARRWLSVTLGALLCDRKTARSSDGGTFSQFQSVATALAATLGTGNIAGVAAALAVGGAGAVFWMWVAAFFGMMTNYAENLLGVVFRRKDAAGRWTGGAMYYLEDGLRSRPVLGRLARPLAVCFALFCLLASFGIGNLAQANTIAGALENAWGLRPALTAVLLAAVCFLVLVGGGKRIGRVTEMLVPFMAACYVGGSLLLLFANRQRLPAVFGGIVSSAFRFRAAAGGAAGSLLRRTVTVGLQRGVFSNEAGLGSTPLAHAASNVKNPAVAGAWGIFSVCFDTFLSCSLTAFVLLSCTVPTVPLPQALLHLTDAPQYLAASPDAAGQILPLFAAEVQAAPPPTFAAAYDAVCYGKSRRLPTRLDPSLAAPDSYTNVLELRGVPATDPAGRRLRDADGNPVLTAIFITRPQGAALVACAFRQRFGETAARLLSVSVLLFAFSTILGWSFYGAQALSYLSGGRGQGIYRGVCVVLTAVGCVARLDLVWAVCDLFNGLMALPNLVGLLALSGVVVRVTRAFAVEPAGRKSVRRAKKVKFRATRR